MSGTRSRASVVLLALVECACSATARGIATVPAPARQPSVTTDVVYGHKDGLALTLDVHRSARPNGAGVISSNAAVVQAASWERGEVEPCPHL